jgi:peroxiredoxin
MYLCREALVSKLPPLICLPPFLFLLGCAPSHVVLNRPCPSSFTASMPSREAVADFSLITLEGKPISLSALTTSSPATLVVFWATWCRLCVGELPELISLQERLGPLGLRIITVSADQEEEELRDFLQKHPLPLTVVRDPGSRFQRRAATPMLPAAILLSPSRQKLPLCESTTGYARDTLSGMTNWRDPRLQEHLRAILNQTP